jgi:hypothetical protein
LGPTAPFIIGTITAVRAAVFSCFLTETARGKNATGVADVVKVTA